MRTLLLLLLAGCVTPIGPEEHAASGDRDRDGFSGAADCDDSNPDVSPSAVEWCNGIDDDCDGVVDGPDARGVQPVWPDVDGDGFGDLGAVAVWSCQVDPGFVANDQDCLDSNAMVFPSAGPEVCDGVDNDCNGLTDGEDPGLSDGVVLYADTDQDGFGDPAVQIVGCSADPSLVDNPNDCDDSDPLVGAIRTWWPDGDGDGHGDQAGASVEACFGPPGHVDLGDDCDDGDPDVRPTASETCNGIDDDCNTLADDGLPVLTWFGDVDGDGFGGQTYSYEDCMGGPGFVANSDDCDDASALRNPSATEVCNGVDDDCDTLVDDSSAVDAIDWYADGDGDGFGMGPSVGLFCSAPLDSSPTNTDCDDTDPAIHPDAPEVCDEGVDNNCNGLADEAEMAPEDLPTWYLDQDLDTFGDPLISDNACLPRYGYIADSSDCDDGDPEIRPGAVEVCDGVDNNCDGHGCGWSGAWMTSDADARLMGSTPGDALGTSLAAADLDGDGIADIAVGSPMSDWGTLDGGGALVFGGPLSLGDTGVVDADGTIGGPVAGESLDDTGQCIATGDLSGDGQVDLVVGSPSLVGVGYGAVHVFSGPVVGLVDEADAMVEVYGADPMSVIGETIAVGDVDNDSTPDLLVGGGASGLFVFSDPQPGVWDTNDASFHVTGSGVDGFGESVVLLDLSGDGVLDLVAGAPELSGTGAVYVWFGPLLGNATTATADVTIAGTAPGDVGRVVQAAGDVNGDGYEDLLIGSPSDNGDAGAVWLVLGTPWLGSGSPGELAAASFTGAAGDRAGRSMAVGDSDGDGEPDLLVGGSNSAWMLPLSTAGHTSLDEALLRVDGGPIAEAGAAVLLRDLTNDGYDDLVIGAPGQAAGSGEVYIFLGEGF